MPRIVKLKDKDGGFYTIVSSYEDVTEKQEPLLWFGSNMFFQLTEIRGYPKDVAKEMSLYKP